MLGDIEHRSTGGAPVDISLPMRPGVAAPARPVIADALPYGDAWGEVAAGSGSAWVAQYWRVLLKHRFIVLGAVAVAVAIGVAITLLMTPIYRAETTLQIEREVAKIVNVEGVEPSESTGSSEEFFQTQYGLLKSRFVAERVVDNLGLARDDNFFKRMGVELDADEVKSAEARRRAAVRLFQNHFGVSPVRGSRLVKLSYESPDSALAAQVVNAAAENFITANLDRRYESADYAREFLQARLAEVKAKLEESERELVAYATSQQIINVSPVANDQSSNSGTQSLDMNSLVALNTALAGARGERIRAEQRLRQSQASSGSALPEVMQNTTIQGLTQTRAKYEADYQDKLRVYKPEFPEMQQIQARVAEVDRQIEAEIRNVQASLGVQYEVALSQERAFEGQVNALKSSALDARQRSIQYDIAQREVDTNRTLYEGLLQRFKEIGVAGAVSANNISIVDRAEPPAAPAKPRPLINVALALLIGLGIGMAIAILLEVFDESISSPEDVETKLSVPLLGSVPILARGETPLRALDDIRSAFAESYYSIRTALQFSTADGVPRNLLITSARPGEGKSTTAIAIARNFARLGLRVLLVDGDLRNPSLHRVLGMNNGAGLTNFLTGSGNLADVTQRTDLATLNFIPCGPLPPNPAELLSGTRLNLFLNTTQQSYDVVVVDGPPVLGLADAPLLAATLAGTIFVLESGGTRRGLAKAAIRRLHIGDVRLLGCVLTKFNAKKASYGYGAGYAYSYAYSYGSSPRLSES